MIITNKIFEKIINDAYKKIGEDKLLKLEENDIIESIIMDTSELEDIISQYLAEEDVCGEILTHTVVIDNEVISILERANEIFGVILLNENKMIVNNKIYNNI